jgi:hypothetical protein
MTAEVTTPESELIRVARAVVGLSSYSEVERLLSVTRPVPAQLGPTAMELLQETLSRGVGLAMLRQGGWRPEGGKRLWERSLFPPIHFHTSSFMLLQWLLKTPLAESGAKAMPGKGPQGWADEALLALALTTVADTPCERSFVMQPRVLGSALCWVVQPAALARHEAPDAARDDRPELDLGEGAPLRFFLEAWQPLLARTWARVERAKGEVTDPGELARIGRAQDFVLTALLAEANQMKRRDLCGFIVEAAAQVLSPKLTGDDWVRSLSPTTPLRDRTEARKQSGALLKALGTLRQWDQEHRAVRFFEEDEYVKAQSMVGAWEVLGDKGFREAERLLSELQNPV